MEELRPRFNYLVDGYAGAGDLPSRLSSIAGIDGGGQCRMAAADFGNVADSGRKCWLIYFGWDGVSASVAKTVASIKVHVLTGFNRRR